MNSQTYSPIVELRMYTLHPGRRDELIRLFEREFIETQEAVGIQVLGQFYDLDDPNRFIWLRGFATMAARAEALRAFYSGPIWKAHRDAANATMLDSDNVLLLSLPPGACGFSPRDRNHPPAGRPIAQSGFVAATICYFDIPVGAEFTHYFENTIQPVLVQAGASVLAHFITEDSPNSFPTLPVREGEHAFVWFAGFSDPAGHKNHLARLRESSHWNDEIEQHLKKNIRGRPEVLRLTPTPRSRLTGNV
jgi:hypothetical protein